MPAITCTHTRTHLAVTPANPWLACLDCGRQAEAFHDDECGCPESGGPLLLMPCFHRSDYRSLCPSWGPEDGCTCPEPHRFPLCPEAIRTRGTPPTPAPTP